MARARAGRCRSAIDEVAASPAGASLPEIELVTEIAEGHPRGTPESVAAALRTLADQDVIAVIGPAISDNALTCVPVTDELRAAVDQLDRARSRRAASGCSTTRWGRSRTSRS